MTTKKIEVPAGKYEGFIFDCDGTLADSMPVHFQAWTATIERLTQAPSRFTEPLFYSKGGVPARGIVEWLNAEHGYAFDVERTADEKENAYIQFVPQVQAIPAVVEVVYALGKEAKLAVASGGLRRIVLDMLRQLKLDDYFKVVVCADDVTQGKPAPEMFLRAAELLEVEPAKCLVFEDGAPGFLAAKAAGMDYIDVRPYYEASAAHTTL